MSHNPSEARPAAQADGTIDAEYTWGMPVSTYLSTLQHLRLLLLKARLDASTQARSATN